MKEVDISLFLCTDELRPVMCNVIYDGRFAYATDAHIALKWDCVSEEITKKAPDVFSVFQKDFNEEIIFNKANYSEWLKELPLVDEEVDCDECDGEGEVEWEYNGYTKMDKCPECDGDGCETTGNKIPNPNEYYNIEGSYFGQRNINKLVHLLDFFDIEEVKIKRENNNYLSAHICHIDKYDLLIMPVYPSKDK